MKSLRNIMLLLTLSLLWGCVSTESNTMAVSKAEEPELQLDLELEIDDHIYDQLKDLKIEEPMEIVIKSDISEDYYYPISVHIQDYMDSEQELHITNYRSSIAKVIMDLFSHNFEVTLVAEARDTGLQLVIEKVELGEYGSHYTYEAAINYLGTTFETVKGQSEYANAGRSEYSFSTEAEWVAGEKGALKPKVELATKHLAEAIYNSVFDSYHLSDINFWEFPFLKTDETINNILFKKGTTITYYNSGTIKKALVSEPITINDVQYTNGTIYDEEFNSNKGIFFFESGALQAAGLLEDTVISELLLAGGHTVEYYESGKLKSGAAQENYTVDGIEYLASTAMEYITSTHFYESGKIQSGYLKNKTKIGKYVYQENSYIAYNKAGKVSWGTLANETKIGGYIFESEIGFYQSGKVSFGFTVKPIKIDGILITSHDYLMVEFYENGKLRAGVTVEDITIGGTEVKAGEYIYLDEKGELTDPPDYCG